MAEGSSPTQALVALGAKGLDEALVRATIGSVLKYREDQQRTKNAGLSDLLGGVRGDVV